jgi:hypothetical protein
VSTTVQDRKAPSYQELTGKGADVSRRQRWQVHRWARANLPRGGARKCMLPVPGEGAVTINVTDQLAAHVSGVQRCGSIHDCALCAPTVREQRAQQIDPLLARAMEAGCSVWFITATLSHSSMDELRESVKRLAGGPRPGPAGT